MSEPRDRNAFDVVSAELPKYRCHKVVSALQIDRVEGGANGAPAIIHFTDPTFAPAAADGNMFRRYFPHPGDYYVVYRDGYKSISPKAEFEDGYTRIS